MNVFIPYLALLVSLASFWLSYRAYLRAGSQSKRASILELARHLSALEATFLALELELTFVRDAADQAASSGRDVRGIQEWIKAVAQMHEDARKPVTEMNENLQNAAFRESQKNIDVAIIKIEQASKAMSELRSISQRKYEPLLRLIGQMPLARNN